MKLKVSLQRPGGDVQDLLVTADASTTVGELAHYLRVCDPTFRPVAGMTETEPTLSLVREANRSLDPRMPLAESPIKSGATIGLSRTGTQFEVASGAVVAVASVLSGPDAGREFSLRSGTNMIGRQRSCEVRLDDPMVSRTHARVNITDHIEIIDLGSANGVEVNGSLISREVVRSSDIVTIGGAALSFRFTQVASAEGRTDSASVGFIRSPRLAPVYPGREFEAPEAPQRSPKQPFPVMMLLLPILMAGVLYLVTKQATTLLFAGLSPLMMLASWWENRRHTRHVDAAALAGFRADLESLTAEIQQEQALEIAGRLHEHPSAAQCAVAVHDRRPLMWTRRPDDWGFLGSVSV